jgi:hypothetical protein
MKEYCGKEIMDSFELPDYVESFDCYGCGESFSVQRDIEITYNTQLKEQSDD